MTDATSPSDEPEVLHLPPGIEIRHYSGATADLLEQLAPLLADEGIDVQQLQEADPEILKAAMMRVVERHNLQLSTPIGDERARTVNTLRELLVAHNASDTAEVQVLFGSIGPAPTRHRPSSGHLTGVTIETLDRVYRNEQFHPALHVVEIPKVDTTTRAATEQILGLAAKGQAFRSLDDLLGSHGGFEVSRAAVLLLTATVQAIAKHRGVGFGHLLDELLPEQNDLQQPDLLPGGLRATPQQYLADFESWLKSQSEVSDIASKVVEIFATMVEEAHDVGLNPHDPIDFDNWMLVVQERTDPKYLGTAFEMVKYYLQFRLRTSIEPERWHHAHAQITELTLPHEDSPWDFEQIFDTAQQVAASDRYAALLELPIVAGSRQLDDWLATPRRVTDEGAPTRDDLRVLGHMIGLDLHGVAQLPSPPARGYVQSALDVPELMIWWWTLQELGILKITGTLAERGPTAQDYFGSDRFPFEGAEGLVATYVKVFLIHALEHAPLEISSVGHTIARLLNDLQDFAPIAPPAADDFRANMVHQRSDEYLQAMASLGLVELREDEPHVPPPLAAAVFYGLMMAMDHLDELLDQHFS